MGKNCYVINTFQSQKAIYSTQHMNKKFLLLKNSSHCNFAHFPPQDNLKKINTSLRVVKKDRRLQ